jgi:fructose-bisphosphate aldolase class II
MGGYDVVVALVKALAAHYPIPVALHLDHGSSYEVCVKAIDAGFTSVMIDASHETFERNLEITKAVVDYAKKHNVSVEAELGRVGGQEEHVVAETMYAIPSECLELVQKTKIDFLAPALGSVHGPYQGEPKLGFKEMEEIAKLVKIPLVLHGGSGIPDEQIKRAVACGTAKINVNTESQQAWTAIVRQVLEKDKAVYDPRKIIGPGKKGIQEVVASKIVLFGSRGKA